MVLSANLNDSCSLGEKRTDLLQELVERRLAEIAARTFTVGVIGLGYVGLPLIRAFWKAEFPVVGFDIDQDKIHALNSGRSYIRHFTDANVAAYLNSGRLSATADFARCREADAIVICVPTPLTKYREPDISYIVNTVENLVPHLRLGQLVVLESTTYPGTTREVVLPILEKSGLKVGEDLFLAFSPEREDPGNLHFGTETIPKVIGADDEASRALAVELFASFTKVVVPVSSSATAEAVKLSENIFRSVNVALVNELKVIFDRMGIDVWDVVDAAKSKPFGYMAFYPGPGLGGHCIPIDPFYLTWKAREYGISTRFIELAGEINTAMPEYVVQRLTSALDDRFGKGLKGTRVLVLGAAYKKNIDDIRESPSLALIDLLRARNADVAYHDPFVPAIPKTREHSELSGMKSVEMSEDVFSSFDAVLISTDHDCIDYQDAVRWSRLVIDTRNATKDVAEHRDRIVKA